MQTPSEHPAISRRRPQLNEEVRVWGTPLTTEGLLREEGASPSAAVPPAWGPSTEHDGKANWRSGFKSQRGITRCRRPPLGALPHPPPLRSRSPASLWAPKQLRGHSPCTRAGERLWPGQQRGHAVLVSCPGCPRSHQSPRRPSWELHPPETTTRRGWGLPVRPGAPGRRETGGGTQQSPAPTTSTLPPVVAAQTLQRSAHPAWASQDTRGVLGDPGQRGGTLCPSAAEVLLGRETSGVKTQRGFLLVR